MVILYGISYRKKLVLNVRSTTSFHKKFCVFIGWHSLRRLKFQQLTSFRKKKLYSAVIIPLVKNYFINDTLFLFKLKTRLLYKNF